MQLMSILQYHTTPLGISSLPSHWAETLSMRKLQSKLQTKAITKEASKHLPQSGICAAKAPGIYLLSKRWIWCQQLYCFFIFKKEKTHECPECGKSFRHKGNLLRHLSHHDPDPATRQHLTALKQGRKKRLVLSKGSQVRQRAIMFNLKRFCHP